MLKIVFHLNSKYKNCIVNIRGLSVMGGQVVLGEDMRIHTDGDTHTHTH